MHKTIDTSTEAEEVQLALMRAMSGRDRVRQACVLSSHLRQMAFDAIRKRFPEMDESENKLAVSALTIYDHRLREWVHRSGQDPRDVGIRRIDSTPEPELVPNDNCLHVCELAAKWPFLQSDQARMEHKVTSKSAIEVSIPVTC